mgnify:CR=1 FL=1
MRIDLFLKNSRIIKRRTVAKSACQGGRVLVNGKEVKPSYEVEEGDIIEVKFGTSSPRLRVKEIIENARKDNQDKMVELLED